MLKSGSPGRILVADDDELVRKLIHTILASRGYAVALCKDGEEALGRSSEGGWTLLILDLNMPGRTGLEVIRELRAEGLGWPVILMSGKLDDGVIDECRELGGVECVPKPFDARELTETVARLAV